MSTTIAAQEARVSRQSGAGLALAVLATTVASAFMMRTVFSPVQDAVKAELHLSDMQLSLLQGLAVALPVALLSLPIGRITDRGNRVTLLIGLSLLWTVGTVWTAFSQDFISLFAARMISGIGSMCVIGVAISVVADLSAPDQRGRAILALSLGNMVGVALAFGLAGGLFGGFSKVAPLLPGMTPWREVHLAFGALSVLLLAPLFLLREPERHEVEVAEASFGAALKELWERRGFLVPLFFGQVTVVMVDTAAGIWAAPVLQRSYHLSPEQSGGTIGLMVLIGGVVGALIGAFAADFGQKLKMKGGVLVGAVIAAVLSIPAAFFPILPDTTMFSIGFAAFVAGGAICGLVTATAIAVVVPNEIRGLCLSLFIVVGAVIGFGLAPTLVTVVSEALGGDQFVGPALAWTGVVTSALGAAGFALALRNGGKRKEA